MTEEKTATGGDFVRVLGEAIRENPLPAALIGMGLTWLFTGGGSPATAGFGWARAAWLASGRKKGARRPAVPADRLKTR